MAHLAPFLALLAALLSACSYQGSERLHYWDEGAACWWAEEAVVTGPWWRDYAAGEGCADEVIALASDGEGRCVMLFQSCDLSAVTAVDAPRLAPCGESAVGGCCTLPVGPDCALVDAR
ncbi:MAG: hypothetical protein JXX28_00530 [Deltaproteobacteria bacterium]|nr:hypothetical protein [Deltaproteobacteria bacterium]